MTALILHLASARRKCGEPTPRWLEGSRCPLLVPSVPKSFFLGGYFRSAGETQSPLPSIPYTPGSYRRSPCVLPDSRFSYVPWTSSPSDSFHPNLNLLLPKVPANPHPSDVSGPPTPPSPASSPAPLMSIRPSVPLMSQFLAPLPSTYPPTPPLFSCLSASLSLPNPARRHLPLHHPCLPP